MLSRREMMGVHGRWSTEEIKDGLVRCGRIEVRLVGLAAILHKAFGRKRKGFTVYSPRNRKRFVRNKGLTVY